MLSATSAFDLRSYYPMQVVIRRCFLPAFDLWSYYPMQAAIRRCFLPDQHSTFEAIILCKLLLGDAFFQVNIRPLKLLSYASCY
ncbi:hypothetical protein L1987_20314 [Smallanthus sonchifolius]|uniref:Uncharacterized protein n=1 Tax=Smallanthus sonchifolius TaxID=185202 RepID=A0ACB9IS88_9ASTR|nr:hypothetical protein L1987_20314 [Smallanthus sonchifolius]